MSKPKKITATFADGTIKTRGTYRPYTVAWRAARAGMVRFGFSQQRPSTEAERYARNGWVVDYAVSVTSTGGAT